MVQESKFWKKNKLLNTQFQQAILHTAVNLTRRYKHPIIQILSSDVHLCIRGFNIHYSLQGFVKQNIIDR